MKHDLSLNEEIERCERRIEARRERAAGHYELTKAEAKERFAKIARWWPLFAVAGSLAIGIAASRIPHRRTHVPPTRVVTVRPAPARGILASILAIAATTLRIAGSHEARTMWNAARAFRARRHAH
jgi:hypothetical protein